MLQLSNEGKMLLALMRAALCGAFDRPVDWDAACSAESRDTAADERAVEAPQA